jgi:hypothetical protein
MKRPDELENIPKVVLIRTELVSLELLGTVVFSDGDFVTGDAFIGEQWREECGHRFTWNLNSVVIMLQNVATKE